jgi:hypothetical protein
MVAPARGGSQKLIGQMRYILGSRSAHLSFLMPNSAANSPNLPKLLERLARQAGEWGAFGLLGEIEEHSQAFEGMRKAGFVVYAWQRIWQLPNQDGNNRERTALWQPTTAMDEIPIRNLYQSLVPPLVQSAEHLPDHRMQGLVYRQGGEVLAYIEGIYGPRAIYLYPMAHPDLENAAELLCNLPSHLLTRLGRPVYLAVRSYQAWLEVALEELNAKVSPRQALMVKHLAIGQRVLQTNPRLAVLENRQAEASAPMVHNYLDQQHARKNKTTKTSKI